ncbi:hypothetical protein BG015_001231 [Linnemannia schmuckeri]|uniref:Transmembrane protein n=1 Tax=Linnemannia schmuckeri TaxID=64567 RepID=A0A9P5RQK1_9FUNG|nr:hypothetical protein BG015_001231 [Linnemannia schmuckeri]
MIFSVPFWVPSLVIAIIKIILSGTIGAILTFYVRYSSDVYANSIRWSRIGGLYETTTLLRNSYQKVPKRSCAIMAAMIFASAFTLCVTIFLGASVSRADMAGDTTSAGITTGQLPPANPLFWTDWNSFMEADATMKDTLELLLNDTRFNHNPNSRAVYTPRKYGYEVPCDEMGVGLGIDNEDLSFVYRSPNDNCKMVFVILPLSILKWDPKQASDRLISPDVHMAVAPMFMVDNERKELKPVVSAFNSRYCLVFDQSESFFGSTFPKDGLTSLPRTDAARCQFGSDDSLVMAVTNIKFAVNYLDNFDKVSASIFDDPSNLPLLQPMRTAINNGTFLNPSNNSTLVILTKMSTNIDLLMCASIFPTSTTGTMGLLCTYLVVATITTKPQQWDPAIPTILNPKMYAPFNAVTITNQNEISIRHMSSRSGNTGDTFSAAHLLKATTDATEYLASLGHNVLMDQKAEQLYILFEIVEFSDAFEVPTPLLIFLLVVILMCIVVWGSAEKLYTPIFNGSLYKVIFEEIESKDKKTPMLMDCTHDSLAFEGYQVIPDLEERSGRSSQEYAMVARGNGSREQPPIRQTSVLQSPIQQSSMLRDNPAQRQVLPPMGPAASTIAIIPASPASPAFPVFPIATSPFANVFDQTDHFTVPHIKTFAFSGLTCSSYTRYPIKAF